MRLEPQKPQKPQCPARRWRNADEQHEAWGAAGYWFCVKSKGHVGKHRDGLGREFVLQPDKTNKGVADEQKIKRKA